MAWLKPLYHIFDDSVYQGKNDASGDTIIMSFQDNELKKLNIIAGARGTYIPDFQLQPI